MADTGQNWLGKYPLSCYHKTGKQQITTVHPTDNGKHNTTVKTVYTLTFFY